MTNLSHKVRGQVRTHFVCFCVLSSILFADPGHAAGVKLFVIDGSAELRDFKGKLLCIPKKKAQTCFVSTGGQVQVRAGVPADIQQFINDSDALQVLGTTTDSLEGWDPTLQDEGTPFSADPSPLVDESGNPVPTEGLNGEPPVVGGPADGDGAPGEGGGEGAPAPLPVAATPPGPASLAEPQ